MLRCKFIVISSLVNGTLFYKKLLGFKRFLLTTLSSNTDEQATTSDAKRHCPPFYSARLSKVGCIYLDLHFTHP